MVNNKKEQKKKENKTRWINCVKYDASNDSLHLIFYFSSKKFACLYVFPIQRENNGQSAREK